MTEQNRRGRGTLNIGITGHRELEIPQEVEAKIREYLTTQKKKGLAVKAYSGIAQGSDTIFARVALELGLELVIVLPFSQEEYEKDFEDAASLDEFRSLLSKGAVMIMGETGPVTEECRPELYKTAGEKIVDMCDTLVAVWDERKAEGVGGTADAVDYARSKKKPVFHIKAYRSKISRKFIEYDDKAGFYKKVYERMWVACLLLSLAAALILAVSIAFHITSFWIALMEIGCVLVALALGTLIKILKLKTKRLKFRRAAERLRVLGRFRKASLPVSSAGGFDEMPEDVKEIETECISITSQVQDPRHSREQLLRLADEQHAYHSKERPDIRSRMLKNLEKLQAPLFLLFLGGVLYHFTVISLEHFDLYKGLPHWLGYLIPLAVPPIYAGSEAYINFKEFYKIENDSRKMVNFFQEKKEQTAGVDLTDPAAAQLKLNGLGVEIRTKMDTEVEEWGIFVMTKHTPGP